MIPFNKPFVSGQELFNLKSVVVQGNKFCGDGSFTKKCHTLLEEQTGALKALLTTSCTHALEMSALLIGIEPGDEVIMPSFTFVSSANAFVLRGAKIVFVDIRPDTMNINEKLIEAAITSKTKAIVPVHYAGVGCDMDVIMDLAIKYDLFVIEDAAQCVGAKWKGKPLGTIGHFGTLSFHETKNLHCGEGGALLINDEKFLERSEVIREKGTNRSKFLRGQVDKYSWMDIGSSYLPSELNAAFLVPQLEQLETITSHRLGLWNAYFNNLSFLEKNGNLELPRALKKFEHNGHIFYIKCNNGETRDELIKYLKQHDIQSVFHYVPLHSASAGMIFGEFNGKDVFTTIESERLIRLPMFYDLNIDQVQNICSKIHDFYEN